MARSVIQWAIRGAFALALLLCFDWLLTEVPLLLAGILIAIAAFWCWRSYKNIPPLRGAEKPAGPVP